MGDLTDHCPAPEKGESLDLLFKSRSSGICGDPDDDDRFSWLPDDILKIIISLLNTSEGAKMSLVSPRFLDLWKYSPVLCFVGNEWVPASNFVKSVNYALAAHRCGNNLKEFKIIKFIDKKFTDDIDNWLEFALSRKVERLELNFLSSGFYPNDIGTNYEFPADLLLELDLKCLKSLSLKNLIAIDQHIALLIHNFPFLERLELVAIHTFYFTTLVISGPNVALKHLRIKDCPSFLSLSISNVNLVSLEIPSLGEDLTLTDLPMLAELSISGTGPLIFTKCVTLSLVGSCFNPQLEVVTLLKLTLEEVIDLDCLARMTKLRRLVVEVIAWDDESLTTFIPIINSCPRLEEFVLMLYCRDMKRKTRNIYCVEGDNSSVQSKSLKRFEFLGYFARASDVEMIVRIVENTVCLEKIVIDPRFPIQLLECPFYLECPAEREARTLAIEQIEALRITQCIQPHIDVILH